MSQIREDESKYKAVFGRKVSEKCLLNFCNFLAPIKARFPVYVGKSCPLGHDFWSNTPGLHGGGCLVMLEID